MFFNTVADDFIDIFLINLSLLGYSSKFYRNIASKFIEDVIDPINSDKANFIRFFLI